MIRYILSGYLLIINLITFVVWGIDKWKAQHNKWRIREKTLLILVGSGGWIGSLIAMEFFRHKTIKGKFLVWFWLWVGIWILFIFALFILFGYYEYGK